MHKQIESTYGPPLAAVRTTHGCVFLSNGRWSVLLSADEAGELGEALVDAAGEARGWLLNEVLPGSKERVAA